MNRDLAVIGVGELGQLYGAGALRAGMRVTPVRRGDDPATALADLPRGTPMLVAVGEADLASTLETVPADRRDDVALIQNELFAARWRAMGLSEPTVAVVWVLKKKGLPVTVLAPSPVHGKHAGTLHAIHEALGLPSAVLGTETERDAALITKYAFILTINVLGLIHNRSVGEWLEQDRQRCSVVALEALTLAARYAGRQAERDGARNEPEQQAAVDAVLHGMQGLAPFPARGRTATGRLERALDDAQGFGLNLPALESAKTSLALGK